MKIVTWNTQWCCGINGRVDPARIVAEAKRLADFDVLCLQEIKASFNSDFYSAFERNVAPWSGFTRYWNERRGAATRQRPHRA